MLKLSAFVCCILIFGLVIALKAAPAAAGNEFHGLARVEDDGTLKVGSRRVHLFGIYIPATDRICRTVLRPVKCRPRAAHALESRARGFVHCRTIRRFRDSSVSAICFADGAGSILSPDIDLSAWMLSQGWAVARPDAPFEYQAFERIARSNGRGLWGFQVDRVR